MLKIMQESLPIIWSETIGLENISIKSRPYNWIFVDDTIAQWTGHYRNIFENLFSCLLDLVDLRVIASA